MIKINSIKLSFEFTEEEVSYLNYILQNYLDGFTDNSDKGDIIDDFATELHTKTNKIGEHLNDIRNLKY